MRRASGFGHAPVSKLIAIVATVSTLALLAGKGHGSVNPAALRIMQGGRGAWWPIVVSSVRFGGVSELMTGLYLIRAYRILERQMGSAKFGSFVFLVAVLGKGLEVAVIQRLPWLRPPTGPYAILGGILVPFYGEGGGLLCLDRGAWSMVYGLRQAQWYVPPTGANLFELGGKPVPGFSDKTFTYMMAFWMALWERWDSAVPSVCGMAVAVVYWTKHLPLQRFRLPGQRLFKMLGPWLDTEEDPRLARRRQMANMPPREPRRQHHQGGGQPRGERLVPGYGYGPGGNGLHRRAVPRAPPPPPPEEAISTLTAMGFDRETVLQALQSTGNNMEAAANRLLGQ